MDFRKTRKTDLSPVLINGVAVERVLSFKFLGLNITEDFPWTTHTSTPIGKAQQLLYFLRGLKKMRLP